MLLLSALLTPLGLLTLPSLSGLLALLGLVTLLALPSRLL